MKLNKQILQALYESKVEVLDESYSAVKSRFIKDGADKEEISFLLDLHKKLKDLKRLKSEEINIDSLVKGKTFDEFKDIMSKYSEKDTKTKTDQFNELQNKIVAENKDCVVYKIDTPEEAYLFHGLVKWCISSGSKKEAADYFIRYTLNDSAGFSQFYFIVRKVPSDEKRWDYIAVQHQNKKDTYWSADDYQYTYSEIKDKLKELNVPKFDFESITIKVPTDWILNSDGSYDVNHGVSGISNYIDDSGKLTIKFNKINGSFKIFNHGLISLEGCPKEVSGDFICYRNKLTSLKGAPEKVSGNFDCNDNKLTSLEGCPEKVGGTFDCGTNDLTSLKGAPKKVGKSFYCDNNELTSLEGAPKEIGKDFDCWKNQLTSLEGAPKEVSGTFDCRFNPKKFTKKEVNEVSKVKGSIYV